jgi:predicted GIY-YIG superfamily endonuclease
MNKDVTQRIAYYTRKVAERVSHHPAKKLPAKYTYRYERLMIYKMLMHDAIQEHIAVKDKEFYSHLKGLVNKPNKDIEVRLI